MSFFSNTLFCIFVSCYILCCSSDNRDELKVKLVQYKNINIQLDTSTAPYTTCAQLLPNPGQKSEKLYTLNENTNSIQVYDLLTNNKVEDIQLSIDGPYGIGEICSFFY
ncbi:DUF4221 family protein [Spirosoma sp. BT702]|uniref:DUF4221 family protein n=1 Tax=Spirosoma profusum TaxID=2771354 RepID=A0A927AUM8_9BACT|nr:DUF4221 family protein [Spirosoma profusum]